MLSTFICTVRVQLRRPSELVWVFAFPIILCTIFLFMFSSLSTDGLPEPVRVAVVADDAWDESVFLQVVDALASEDRSGGPLLEVHRTRDSTTAKALVRRGDVIGYYSANAQGGPALTLASSAPVGTSDAFFEADRSILDTIASSYAQNAALVEKTLADDPSIAADPAAIERALGISAGIERVRLTHGTPDETVRYYYALLGMAALMAAEAGVLAVVRLQPAESDLAARVCSSGTSRVAQLTGALLGGWFVSMLALSLAFAYMRLVAGIDFSGRDALCIAGLAAASLLSTAIGALIGVLPLRGGPKAKMGMVTAFSCLMSLFAGLYGEGAMRLSDNLARTFPASTWINPARLITDQFYALYYYDSLEPFALRAAACVGAASMMLGIACAATLRSSHEHL